MELTDAKSIFQRAIDLPADQRAAFLDRCCGDADVRARVVNLLRAHDAANAFLLQPVRRPVGGSEDCEERPGDQIGPYRLLDRLGEGGFGVVWRAEQQQPVRREVALKIVRPGSDGRRVFARFDQERQVLARMNHANVAVVYDGGETADGRPYFAMELVPGAPITEFCDREQYDLPARLRLFVQVCLAVQHAHHKGVLHRDIKPSNVLVATRDGAPMAKVIDFGIAKAIHGPPTASTLKTGARTLLGTPDYMAPEQASLTGVDVDTRADVYALGVLLYELLTGALPHRRSTTADQDLFETLRSIREGEPPPPSTRVRTPGPISAEAARRRRSNMRGLSWQLRGDLDWIVMRALERDRERRYGTPQELASDVLRHLAHEPVIAGPPSFGYRAKKLLRRHRGRAIAAAAVLVTMAVGAAGMGWFAVQASHQATAALASKAAFDHLAVLVELDAATAGEAELDPATPERLPKLAAWLADCERLQANRADIERTLHDLHARALPTTPEQLAADVASHPLRSAWQDLAADVAGERRAQAVRAGAPLVVPELPPEVAAMSRFDLANQAWARVAWRPGQRSVHGEEGLGLAMALAALAKPAAPRTPLRDLLDTLACAYLANGADAEAVKTMQQAVDAAPAKLRYQYEGFQRELLQRCEAAVGYAGKAGLALREVELAALEATVHARRAYRFVDPAEEFLHARLTEALDGLDRLRAGPMRAVERRRRWAERVDVLTLAHPKAQATWSDVIADAASGAIGGVPFDLRVQRGLVPIGKNPAGLWEFYHLRSAWDGECDPATIDIPELGADGSIVVGDDTGLVFVLLPGGDVVVGAQAQDPAGAHYDAHSTPQMGTVRHVLLQPFFLSRYEMTQGQWRRLWTGDPALAEPSFHHAGMNLAGVEDLELPNTSYANPVEHVDWTTCDQLLRQYELELPSEVQWEYGCRAGSDGPWSCPLERLHLCANLSDRTAMLAGAQFAAPESWADGLVVHARVGSLLPNAFGIHDMHGNVAEWCRDGFSGFGGAGEADRLPGEACHGARGGAYDTGASLARASFGMMPATELRSPDLGLRPARVLQR